MPISVRLSQYLHVILMMEAAKLSKLLVSVSNIVQYDNLEALIVQYDNSEALT